MDFKWSYKRMDFMHMLQMELADSRAAGGKGVHALFGEGSSALQTDVMLDHPHTVVPTCAGGSGALPRSPATGGVGGQPAGGRLARHHTAGVPS